MLYSSSLRSRMLPSSTPGSSPRFPELPEHSVRIRDQLSRILKSSGFVNSERMRQFLRFVVERALEGDAQRLKESVIGVEVFDRDPSYDPKVEPIVRIEARRLREKLHEYYKQEGIRDAVVIHLPKGGYAPVFEMRPLVITTSRQEISDTETLATVPPPPIASSRTRWLLRASVAALSITAAVFIVGRRTSNRIPTLAPLTSLPGYAYRPSISPDGKRVAFVWDAGSYNSDIYVKLINTGDPFRLTTSPEVETDPAWSPDGSRIAFRRIFSDRSEIILAPALGGAERRLAVQTLGRHLDPVDPAIRLAGPVWLPDGRQIAIMDSTGDQPPGIHLVDLESGEKQRLTTPGRRDEWDSDAAFSPQGDRLAFVRWRAGASGSGDLYVQSVKGGEPKRLTFDRRWISGVTWTPDGQRIIFASDRNGDFRLWQIGLHGESPAPVAGA